MDLSGRILRLPALLLVAVLLTGCFAASEPKDNNGNDDVELTSYSRDFLAMSTVVSVQFFAPPDLDSGQVFNAVLAEMQRLEDILSAHVTGSDVSRVDAAAGVEPVKVSLETLEVIQTALDYAELTEDTFDITLAPILGLYNFTPGEESKPTRWQLETSLPLVNWRRVEVDHTEGTVFLRDVGMKMDLGGIAKGYIVDRTAEILREFGLDYGVINAGGDISVLGPKPDGTPWRVGIKNPDRPENLYAVAEINGGSIVSSGDYERYFDQGDVRYHHIIDPATGLPAQGLRSVTVIAPTAELADLLSTAIFVMGASSGLNLVESLPGIEVIIWDKNGEVSWSTGLANMPALATQSGVDYFFR